jgi:hypothetical protein
VRESTIADDFFYALASFRAAFARGRGSARIKSIIVYAGDQTQKRSAAAIVPCHDIDQVDWS